jgi:hypothetical protein
MQRKKLPIGIQTFAKIREEDHYYVDKTPLALHLIAGGTHYFLSRPRRFGKSLLLDTLKELFEGNKELFTGLYAENHWDWSKTHPVLRLSFGGGVLKTADKLAASLHKQLSYFEKEHQVVQTFPDASSRLTDLIETLHERTGQRVVVLVDEYDKPILDNIAEPDVARVMREGLRDIYSVLKDADEHLHFVFITGVSKFSKVSLFSGLNNLNDITVDAQYSSLCGYTDHDVNTVFAPELPGLDLEQIRRWYNGYNWTGESVYNPFDLLLLFKNRIFKPYWFETGTPTFLVEYLAERRFFTPNLAQLQAGEALLSRFDVDDIAPEALLWQAGYLTIHSVEEASLGQWVYTLSYPNREVEISLNASLINAYGGDEALAFNARIALIRALKAGETSHLRDHVHALFASIPHDWYRNNPLANYEGFYASVFYSHIAALGFGPRVEDATNKGRIDLAFGVGSRTYLFEFKVVDKGSEGKALEQLRAKGYAEKYREPGMEIILVGIEFSREARNVVGFEVASA